VVGTRVRRQPVSRKVKGVPSAVLDLKLAGTAGRAMPSGRLGARPAARGSGRHAAETSLG